MLATHILSNESSGILSPVHAVVVSTRDQLLHATNIQGENNTNEATKATR
ncbi:MAG: hypothetical protein Fur0025_18130 [Oscillatoriaceae cyanobacterium]